MLPFDFFSKNLFFYDCPKIETARQNSLINSIGCMKYQHIFLRGTIISQGVGIMCILSNKSL
jgi:hypothetical protein